MKLPFIMLTALVFLSPFSPIFSEDTTGQTNLRHVGPLRGQVQGGKVTGIVQDPSGAALAEIRVVLLCPNGKRWTTKSNQAGRYKFDRLPSGKNCSLGVGSGTGLDLKWFPDEIIVENQRETRYNVLFEPGATPTPTPAPSPRPTVFPSPRPTPTARPSPQPSAAPTPRPSPLYSPTPLSSPSPSASPAGTDWEALIRREEAKLHESKIAFNPPSEMREQKTEIIQARISFGDIGPALNHGLQGPGKPQEEPLKVSEVMTVTLTGDGNAFLIQKIGDEEQVVAGKPYAQWEWHVTPLQSGDQKLTLTAAAKIFLDGRGEKSIYYKTLEQPIIVHVDRWYTAKQFVANNWQWLWAVIVVPVAGLLWGLRRRKGRRAGFR